MNYLHCVFDIVVLFNTTTLSILQANAFRTLRFLFSMERNRKLFKRLFPPTLFEMFIDIGHYRKDIAAYRPLVDKLHTLSVSRCEIFVLRILCFSCLYSQTLTQLKAFRGKNQGVFAMKMLIKIHAYSIVVRFSSKLYDERV